MPLERRHIIDYINNNIDSRNTNELLDLCINEVNRLCEKCQSRDSDREWVSTLNHGRMCDIKSR